MIVVRLVEVREMMNVSASGSVGGTATDGKE
jgi:hypothetical protein